MHSVKIIKSTADSTKSNNFEMVKLISCNIVGEPTDVKQFSPHKVNDENILAKRMWNKTTVSHWEKKNKRKSIVSAFTVDENYVCVNNT